MTGISLGHLARLGIFPIKNILYYLQEALPFRLKGLHFFNIVSFIDKIVFLMKPFMKKEMWDIFHLHTNVENLYKFIDAKVMPSDYPGGEAEPLTHLHAESFQQLLACHDYFLEEEQTRRVDEKARLKSKGGMFSGWF